MRIEWLLAKTASVAVRSGAAGWVVDSLLSDKVQTWLCGESSRQRPVHLPAVPWLGGEGVVLAHGGGLCSTRFSWQASLLDICICSFK